MTTASGLTADVVVAETGADMTKFPGDMTKFPAAHTAPRVMGEGALGTAAISIS
jgi:hypothetical protein